MLLEKRIEAFSKLGEFLGQFSRKKIEAKKTMVVNLNLLTTVCLSIQKSK